MKHCSIILIVCTFIFLPASVADSAPRYESIGKEFIEPKVEVSEYQKRSVNFDSVSNMRADIDLMLEQNRSLKEQHAALKQKYDALQTKLELFHKEILEMGQDYKYGQMAIADLKRKGALIEPSVKISDPEAKALLTKSKVSFLEGKILDINEELKQLRAEYARLNNKNKSLSNGNGKYAQIKKTKKQQELINLKKKIEQNKKQEEELAQEIIAIEDSANLTQREQQELNLTNLKMKKKLLELEQDIDLKMDQNRKIKAEHSKAKKSINDRYSKKENQQAKLQKKVNQLEKEYIELEESVLLSLELQSRKKEIVSTVLKIDQKNQALRKRISELQSEINFHSP